MTESDHSGSLINALYDQLARDCLAAAAAAERKYPWLTITVGPYGEHGATRGARLLAWKASDDHAIAVDIAPGTPLSQIEKELRAIGEQPIHTASR